MTDREMERRVSTLEERVAGLGQTMDRRFEDGQKRFEKADEERREILHKVDEMHTSLTRIDQTARVMRAAAGWSNGILAKLISWLLAAFIVAGLIAGEKLRALLGL